MSDYVRVKAIRYPLTKEDLKELNVEDIWDLEEKFNLYNDKCRFEVNSSDKYEGYLDCVLKYEYGSTFDDYGLVYELDEKQKERWCYNFNGFFRINIDENKLRLVEYCYYNGVDCPDYYDELTDKPTDDEKWIL